MSVLRGKLQSISLTDLLQLLHANRKTGELLVTRGRQSGVLYVVNGEVVHAETPKAQGESAAFDILEWDQGHFEFATAGVKVHTTIKRTVPDLLMEAARTTDSRRHLATVFPDLGAVPWAALKEPQLSQGLEIFPEGRGCLPLLDGYRSLQEIIEETGQGDVSVLQACATLQTAGRLQLLAPTRSATIVPVRTGFFQRGDQIRLGKDLEAEWLGLGPFHWPIERVRVLWPQGQAVAWAQFDRKVAPGSVGIPKELLQSWELSEGILVGIRPAP